jgi:hypothetical protein
LQIRLGMKPWSRGKHGPEYQSNHKTDVHLSNPSRKLVDRNFQGVYPKSSLPQESDRGPIEARLP